MLEHASPLEIFWTGIMLTGVIVSLWNWAYALQRLRELIASKKNGVLKRMRGGVVADQLKLVGVFVCLTVLGIYAISTPPPPGTARELNPLSLLLIGAGLVLVWLSLSMRIRQAAIAREIEKILAHGDSDAH